MEKLNIAFLGAVYEDILEASDALFDKMSDEKNVIILNLIDFIEYTNNYKVSDLVNHFGDGHYMKTEYKALSDISGFDGAILQTTPTLALREENILTLKEHYFTVGLTYKASSLKKLIAKSNFFLSDIIKKDISGDNIESNIQKYCDMTLPADNFNATEIASKVYEKVKNIKGYN